MVTGFKSSYTDHGEYHTIEAEIPVSASLKNIWAILTDYENIDEFIPGMERSEVIKSYPRGAIVLEQEGAVSIFPFTFRSRILLQIREDPMKRITFEMIEGDFDSYRGSWTLKRSGSTVIVGLTINASYPVRIPRFFISRSLSRIARNSLSAIAEEAERRAGSPDGVSAPS